MQATFNASAGYMSVHAIIYSIAVCYYLFNSLHFNIKFYLGMDNSSDTVLLLAKKESCCLTQNHLLFECTSGHVLLLCNKSYIIRCRITRGLRWQQAKLSWKIMAELWAILGVVKSKEIKDLKYAKESNFSCKLR